MYHDTDPHRRNLIVLSLLLLIYFAAGGDISPESFNFPFFDVNFSRPYILPWVPWVMLVWFTWRYLQVHPYKGFLSKLIADLADSNNHHPYKKYLEKTFNIKIHSGYFEFQRKPGWWTLKYRKEGERDNQELRVQGRQLVFLKVRTYLFHTIRKPLILEFWPPLILAGLAVTWGICRYISKLAIRFGFFGG